MFGVSPRLPFEKAYQRLLSAARRACGDRPNRAWRHCICAGGHGERAEQPGSNRRRSATALLTGADHVFQIANPLCEQLVGRTHMVGKTFLEAFPELLDTPFPALTGSACHRSGKPFVRNEMLLPLIGPGTATSRTATSTSTSSRCGTPPAHVYAMMAVAVDITPQVSARRALEKAHGERESLLRELESASRARDEFLAMLGHELRNPLAPILTALQLIRMRGIQGVEKGVLVIERQVRHVVRLVDDLMDVSRVTRGKIRLEIEPLRLADVVAKGIEMASPIIEERKHRLTVAVADDLMVDGDAGRLAQVLSNVLDERREIYGPPRARSTWWRSGRSRMRGFRFATTAWASTRDAAAACSMRLPRSGRTAVDRRAGSASAWPSSATSSTRTAAASRSKARGAAAGTVCRIRLPISSGTTALAPSACARDAEVPAARGASLLLVDDNVDASAILAESLRALGYRVRVAHDGVAALEMARQDAADVAVLDLGLPVMDGYEVAARLRALPGCLHIRLIALTGYGLDSDRQRTRAAGFDEHFVKPIDVDILDLALRSPGRPRV